MSDAEIKKLSSSELLEKFKDAYRDLIMTDNYFQIQAEIMRRLWLYDTTIKERLDE